MLRAGKAWQLGQVLLEFFERALAVFGPPERLRSVECLEEWKRLLCRAGKKLAKGCQPACKFLYLTGIVRLFHFLNSLYLFGVGFDAPLGYSKSEKFSCLNTEGTLLWVELDSILAKVFEGFLQVLRVFICQSTF